MKNKWKDFERIIAAIHAETDGAAVINWNDEIMGRQFDVSVRFKHGLHEYLTVIECKDYAGRVPVEKVDAFVTKTRDINANKAVMVAANGFQSGCIEVARRHGITLLALHESVGETVEPQGGLFIPSLNVYRVRLVKEHSDEEVEFEEWNGKLEYLMTHCILSIAGKTTTPLEVFEEWRHRERPEVGQNEARFEIPFPSGTIAKIPFQDSFKVATLRFHCRMRVASLSDGSDLCRHLREINVLQHELHDCITGGIVYTMKQADLKIGFDVELQTGKFYVGLHGTSHYYCVEIKDNLATMLMVESYQHGELIQVKFVVKLENAKCYVDVKDEKTLIRLQKMLDDYNQAPNCNLT